MRTSRYIAEMVIRVSVSINSRYRDAAIKELKLRKFAVVSDNTGADGLLTLVAERRTHTWDGDDYLLIDHVAERRNLMKEFEAARDNARVLASVLKLPL